MAVLTALLTALLPGVVAEPPIPALAPISDRNTVVAVVDHDADLASVDAEARAMGLTRVGAIPEIGVLQYRPQAGGTSAARARLAALPGVRSATPTVVTALATPDDPYLSLQWGLQATHARDAWATTEGAGVTVGVVDTGIALSHPDLAAQVVPGGYDFVNHDGDPSDDNGHGTHVSGIVGAVAGNGIAGAGAAPAVRILPVKVLDASGSGSSTNVAAGITYAVDHGANVINLSLGSDTPMPDVAAAVTYAVGRNVTVVAAAGNSGNGVAVGYPAAYPNVIAVGAVDAGLRLASFSQTGTNLDLVAPGVSIASTWPPASAVYLSGTSMAAPFVSAAAALLLSLDRSQSPGTVESRLEASADDLGAPGRDTSFGAGLVDMARAVALVKPAASPSPTASAVPSASPSPTAAPSASPTASPGRTGAPSASAAPSQTADPSASPSPSVSPTPSGSPTPAPTKSPSPPQTATKTVSITLARRGTFFVSVVAAPTTAPLRLVVRTAAGRPVGNASGTGALAWSRYVAAGRYLVTISAPTGTSITLTWRPATATAHTTRLALR